MPKVSVIIPTHNRRDRLQNAIRSVLSQTYTDYELLIIDDGSTDGTSELSLLKDPRVRYFFQENQGVSSARNLGIREARGAWIAFLDSDDDWLPQKLEKQMAFHGNTSYLISQTEEIWIRHGKRVNAMNKHRKLEGWIFEPSLKLCLISPSSVLLSREVFEKTGLFDESFEVCEDYDLWLRLTIIYPVGLLQEPLIVKYGGHEDQLSRRHWGMDRFRIHAMEKLLEKSVLSQSQREACLTELEEKCRIYAQGCKKRNRFDEAEKFLEKLRKYGGAHAVLPA